MDGGGLSITFAPRQLLPILKMLRAGAPDAEDVHVIGQALNGIPGFGWEQFEGPVVAPAIHGPQMVRITQQTIDFWTDFVDEELDEREIRWTDVEYRIFQKIVQSMGSKKGFNIAIDLSSGQGTLSQTVQVPEWRIDRSCEWFTMGDVTEYDQKLGAAHVQPSRFKGSYTTSYWRGEITPRRVMAAILAGQE